MNYYIPYYFPFAGKEHRDFFDAAIHEIGSAYPGIIVTIYLLSATEETRAWFWSVVDLDGMIQDDLWDTWTDEDSRRCVALAVDLACGDSYRILSPATLYDSPLRPVLCAAVEYWLANNAT